LARGIEALVTPELLRWARESAGLTIEQAASGIDRSAEELSAWERGELRPSIPQARKLAELYKRPLAVFFLPKPPTDFQPLADFRRLPEGASAEYSSELRFLIREAISHQEWVRSLLEDENEPKLSYVGMAKITDDPSQLAIRIRSQLRISDNEILQARSGDDALRIWIEHAEASGIFVFQSSRIETVEARGFALPDEYAPFVFMNSKDSRAARVFTLIHELVHVWLGLGGVSNPLQSGRPRPGSQPIETFCNLVAGQIIAPAESMLRIWRSTSESDEAAVRVRIVADKLKVSREVIALRLLHLREISPSLYQDLKQQFDSEWKLIRDRLREREGGPAYSVRVVQSNGRAFTQIVLEAYRSGAATSRDVAALLNAKINNLPSIMAEAGGRRLDWSRVG
jgi:Zn-dependent peptidase ImmA (M78 family)/DNA-binding XRE family transcriptional regulator